MRTLVVTGFVVTRPGFDGPNSAEEGTGTCLILVTPDSERTMFTHLGISSQLHPENVDETIVKVARVVEGSRVKYFVWLWSKFFLLFHSCLSIHSFANF